MTTKTNASRTPAPSRTPFRAARIVNGYGARVLVVPAAKVAEADAIILQHLGQDWAEKFFYRQPPWNDLEVPEEPPADCKAQICMSNESEVTAFEAACLAVCSQIPAARTYDASSIAESDHEAYPRNTMDSLYTTGYDHDLPVGTLQVGVALWYLQTTGSLPPRENFGGE